LQEFASLNTERWRDSQTRKAYMVPRQHDLVQKMKIKATPDQVFSALTEEHELLKWWPTQVEVDLREGGGFRRNFEPYVDCLEKGQFLRIIPNQLLKYSAESTDFPNVSREITIEFKPSGEHTQVLVTEAGWKRGRLWEKMYRTGEAGWKQILHDLKTYCETGNDPRIGRKIVSHHPERGKPIKLVIKQRYLYKAKPKKVFQALTVPDRLTKWLLKEAEVEFRRHGKIKMVWNDGYTLECKILKLELNKKLTLGWPTNGWAGTPNATTIVKFRFHPTEEENTILEIEHLGFGSGDAWARYYGLSYSGWTYYLLNLKSVLENGIDLRDEVSESVVTEPEENGKEAPEEERKEEKEEKEE
jgi:uncharacterized protein YndB with AHSA1/START domain